MNGISRALWRWMRILAIITFALQVSFCSNDLVGPTLLPKTLKLSGWYWQNPLPQGSYLFAVTFVGGKVGMAVGDNGMILRTTDGGRSWIGLASGTGMRLEDVVNHEGGKCD